MTDAFNTPQEDFTEQANGAHVGDIVHESNQQSSDIAAQIKTGLEKSGRELPHSTETESAILSSILVEQEAFEEALSEGLRPEDFYAPRNALIFAAMCALQQIGEPINTITVVNQLRKSNDLERAGGVFGIGSLEAAFPASVSVAAYARIVKEKSALRKLIQVSSSIYQNAHRQDKSPSLILEEAEKAILAIGESTTQKETPSIHQLAMEALNKFSGDMESTMGISSGFHAFDRLTNGLNKGELIIIAARPSMGKTAFTLNIASHVALHVKKPVAFFSLEMGADQLVHRMVGAEAQVDLSALRRGQVQEADAAKIVAACGQIAKMNLHIDESPTLTIGEMRNKCRRLKNKHGIELIIVDYLQLMSSPSNYDNKATEVGEISKGLKSIARELKVPVIALSQLNRGVESRTDKRPMMSDLRESGAIEQDADIIAFLYREEYYLREKTPEDKLGIAEVIISKNRNGPTGELELRFFNKITRFVDLDRHHKNYGYA